MAGGIDWFRWHHGSVTDPKFQLVARKAGVRLGDVLGVWAFLLEKASASADRGSFGSVDAEAVDLLFGLEDGQTAEILRQMEARGLIGAERVEAWDRRQPKREREEDPTAADRKRRQRAREADAGTEADGVTDDCHAMSRQVTPASRHVTPREEERREEGNTARSDDLAPARPPAEPPQLALVEDGSKPKRRTVPDCPHVAILALWAEVLPALPQHDPEQWRGTRADHLRARWRETAASKGWETVDEGMRYLRKLFAYVGQSDFLTGKTHTKDRRPFVIELEWLVNPTNWAKVIEGKYHQEAA